MDRHHDLKIRFRLYNQCVLPIVFYGIFELRFTNQGSNAIVGTINAQHRSMAYVPVHFICVPIDVFFSFVGVGPSMVCP